MKIKYFLVAILSFITAQSALARELTITNPSDYNIIVLPFWKGQGTYDFIPAPTAITHKQSKKTYKLWSKTIQQISWISLTNQATSDNIKKLMPQKMIKYVAKINMGPLGNNKNLTILNDGNYAYYDSNNYISSYQKANIVELSPEEQRLIQ